VQPPPTQYVARDRVSIAYQVVGDGPIDVLLAPGFISHLDLAWSDPGTSRMLERLASFSRLILYDKPGTGLSDPIAHLPSLEERGADIEAVLDAAGSQRTILYGVSEGGPAAIMLAATHPERISSLILYGTFAVMPHVAPELYPAGITERMPSVAAATDLVEHWGDGARIARIFAPSLGALRQRALGTFCRASASPRMAEALLLCLLEIDVRDVLPSVRVPTLVLHLSEDRVVPLEASEILCAGIPDARLVTFPGVNHAFWLDQQHATCDSIVDQIERFVTGTVRPSETDRVLATVLFTDIVSSTERAAELGDNTWRRLLERHDALVEQHVAENGGRVVKHLGDGALSSFDGPARAIRCAQDLREAVGELGVELRAGIHTGECEAIGDDLGGLAVHIGARISTLAAPREIVVSSTVKELVVGSHLDFTSRGEHELKGVPGAWRLYSVGRRSVPPTRLDGPASYMRRSDRLAVSLARTMPRAMRFGARLAGRREQARSPSTG
jgi:pimeloyl-ACP methyl ester carboxylesterase/class 3 adenylate cyclase